MRGTAGESGYTISINISAAEAIDEWVSPPPPPQYWLQLPSVSSLSLPASPLLPFSEVGDMQALANLNMVAKQYLRLHASQCWF